jgi:hypothetical protein
MLLEKIFRVHYDFILREIIKSGGGKEAAQIFWIRGATIARIARRDE